MPSMGYDKYMTDKPTKYEAPTSTRAYLVEQGGRSEVVQRLKSSLKFANENILTVGDKFSTASIDLLLLNPQPRIPDTSAKGFFDGVRPMDEAIIAQTEGIPREAIMNSAGVWGKKFVIQPEEERVVLGKIKFGLHSEVLKIEDGLKEIYEENANEVNYGFDDRLKHVVHWRNVLANHRTQTDKKGYKEIYNVFDPKIGVLPRDADRSDLDSLFKVEVVSEDDVKSGKYDRDFNGVVDRNLIAKVILVKNAQGNITEVETWFSHFTSDEEQGDRLIDSISENLNVDENANIGGTEILRHYQLIDSKDRKAVNIFDIDSNTRIPAEELALYKEAAKYLDLSKASLIAQMQMALSGEKNSYLIVSPDKSSGLQVALMVSPNQSTHLKNLLDFLNNGSGDLKQQVRDELLKKGVTNWSDPRILVELGENAQIDGYITNYVLGGLRDISSLTKDEVFNARRGWSTLGILSTYVSGAAQKLFKSVLTTQHNLISNSSTQVSSVDHKTRGKSGRVFVTASNISADNCIGLEEDNMGLNMNLRVITDRAIQDQIEKTLAQKGINDIYINDYAIESKKIVRQKLIDLRRSLLAISVIALRKKIDKGPFIGKQDKFLDLYSKATNVLIAINQESQQEI